VAELCSALADSSGHGLQGQCDRGDSGEAPLNEPRGSFAGTGREGECAWPTEPDVGRVAHGIPRRVDRLRALGNAVVPQVVYELGRAIMKEVA
jgi:DNA (cytosine-5)-methyltransferase 1